MIRNICLSMTCWLLSFSGMAFNGTDSGYRDLTHYSRVFGHDKAYRLYLPEGYATDKASRWPVIYFFHGWGGRHFKDDNALLAYGKIKMLVDRYRVMLVMWDGNVDLSEPRPYNVGNHEDVKFPTQMKDYFVELVSYIDSSYRTLTDRGHRGIIGFSMGGFMSFFLAGKYPDKVSAAVSLAGSPEFFVGYPDDHTLYPMRYAFENLREVACRMHNGDSDILTYLNREVKAGADWDGRVRFDYWPFPGGHMVDKTGETVVFEKAMRFVTEAFAGAVGRPSTWSHYDLYPSFDVWGYQVTSNKKEPGFLYLRNVSKSGFGLYTRRWLPLGPEMDGVSATVTTAPVYEKNALYKLVRYQDGKVIHEETQSNEAGRIRLSGDGEVGIYKDGDAPAWVCLPGKSDRREVMVKLFNRGGDVASAGSVKVRLSGVAQEQAILVSKGQRVIETSFAIASVDGPPAHGEPSERRYRVQAGGIDAGEIVVPVFYNAPTFDSIKVQGASAPGQRVSLTQAGHNLYVYTDDPYLIARDQRLKDEMIPARWPDGFTLSNEIHISPDCPNGHVIKLLGRYETKTFNPIERKLTWGWVDLKVGTTAGTAAQPRRVQYVAPDTGSLPRVIKTDHGYRLMVDGKPFIALGAQLWNSSNWPYILREEWPQLKELHANTLEAPVYWQQVEPQQGVFRFSELDSLIFGARQAGIRLVVLWFGSFKNGSSSYAPEWILTHPEKYPRMLNAGGEEIQVLSAVSPAGRQADAIAFARLMRHLREVDGAQHTVIMVQVENESGSLGTDRDYSPAAEAAFKGNVPAALTKALGKPSGSWEKVFGLDAAETFSAWYVGSYINEVAAAGKKEYDLPMYANVWLKEHAFRRPGEYPSGGPVSTMIPVWRVAAPTMAFIAPDLYHSNHNVFLDLCSRYRRPEYAFFIPEMGKGIEFVRQQFYALGNYDALGVAVYGIDPFHADPNDLRDKTKLDEKFAGMAENYRLLSGVIGKLADLQGTGNMAAVGEEPGLNEKLVSLGNYDILCSFGYPTYRKKTGTGRAIIAALDEDEFLVVGFDTKFQFRPKYGSGYGTAEYVSIEEGYYEKGQWVRKRFWNGDEAYHSILTPEGTSLKIKFRRTKKANTGKVKANFE